MGSENSASNTSPAGGNQPTQSLPLFPDAVWVLKYVGAMWGAYSNYALVSATNAVGDAGVAFLSAGRQVLSGIGGIINYPAFYISNKAADPTISDWDNAFKSFNQAALSTAGLYFGAVSGVPGGSAIGSALVELRGQVRRETGKE